MHPTESYASCRQFDLPPQAKEQRTAEQSKKVPNVVKSSKVLFNVVHCSRFSNQFLKCNASKFKRDVTSQSEDHKLRHRKLQVKLGKRKVKGERHSE